MTEKREKKNVLIGGLLVAIIAMAVGYAALAQQLTINGTAQVSSTWDVQMTSISEGTATNSTGITSTAENVTTPTITGNTTASFDVQFKTPGDTMEYDIIVSNLGSLDAKLSNVVVAAQDGSGNVASITEANGINYEITIDDKSTADALNSVIKGKTADSTATSKVHVKVWWDAAATSIPTNPTKILTVTLEYAQA